MLLTDLVKRLDEFEPDDVGYVPVGSEVDGQTNIVLQNFQVSEIAPAGTKYFLEVGTMREIRDGLKDEIGREPTADELVKAVIFYAEHDAYIDPCNL